MPLCHQQTLALSLPSTFYDDVIPVIRQHSFIIGKKLNKAWPTTVDVEGLILADKLNPKIELLSYLLLFLEFTPEDYVAPCGSSGRTCALLLRKQSYYKIV